MHSHLNLDDLKFLYGHVVSAIDSSGGVHPPNHPIDVTGVTSRTALIEAMTTDYGVEGFGGLMIWVEISGEYQFHPDQLSFCLDVENLETPQPLEPQNPQQPLYNNNDKRKNWKTYYQGLSHSIYAVKWDIGVIVPRQFGR